MGVLDQPLQPQLTAAEQIAAEIKQNARQTFNALLQVYDNGAKFFWQNPHATPQDIAAALGTDAVEVFQLHGKIGALLASIKPDAVTAVLAVVGSFEYHENGTITVLQTTVPAE